MERKRLKIYIPGTKFPSQDRGVSPPTSLLTPSPQGNFSSEKFHQSSYVLIRNSRSKWALESKLLFQGEFTFNSAQWAQTRKNSKGTGKILTKAHPIKSKFEKHVETHVHDFAHLNTFDQPLLQQRLLGGFAPHKPGNCVSQTLPSFLNAGGGSAPCKPF